MPPSPRDLSMRPSHTEHTALIVPTESPTASQQQSPFFTPASDIPLGNAKTAAKQYDGFVEDSYDDLQDPALDAQVVALGKGSIFSLEAVAEVKRRRGFEAARQFFKGRGSVPLQCLMFAAAVVTGSANLLIYEAALWNDKTKKKEMNFIPGTLYISYYVLSMVTGNIVSYSFYGKSGWKDCWNRRALLFVLPSAVFLAAVETMDVFVMKRIDASVRAVIAQSRLPLLALVGIVVLKRRQSAVQWTFIVGITLSVIGFSLAAATQSASAEMNGMILCVIQSLVAACGNTVSEVTFKRLKFPFCIQIAQARFLSFLASTIVLLVYCWNYQCFDQLFFSGWDIRIVFLAVWLMVRDWINTFMIKLLSALWKSLSAALALCLTYAIKTIAYDKPFNPVLAAFTLCVVTDIIGYTLTKRDAAQAAAKKLAQQNEDIALKVVPDCKT